MYHPGIHVRCNHTFTIQKTEKQYVYLYIYICVCVCRRCPLLHGWIYDIRYFLVGIYVYIYIYIYILIYFICTFQCNLSIYIYITIYIYGIYIYIYIYAWQLYVYMSRLPARGDHGFGFGLDPLLAYVRWAGRVPGMQGFTAFFTGKRSGISHWNLAGGDWNMTGLFFHICC